MDEGDARSRVLIVEDEDAIRDLIAFHLDLTGYDCTSVGDGQDTLELRAHRPFDVIVLDVALPSVDGVTLCRAIRRDGANRDVPIIMLTARREEADKVLGLESGADDYLTDRSSGTRCRTRRPPRATRAGRRRSRCSSWCRSTRTSGPTGSTRAAG
jgi:DNA-binding response OmpR family regulator